VPLLNASITDAVFEVERRTTAAEVNELFRTAANGPLGRILGYEELPLVSADYRGETRSAVIDAGSTMVIDGTQVKVLAWYDNETGYVYRMLDLLEKVGSTLTSNPTELATEMSVS
jgi:glyceraldehyde 3-phosphate dehydrogenase